jgi:hypothetical protein
MRHTATGFGKLTASTQHVAQPALQSCAAEWMQHSGSKAQACNRLLLRFQTPRRQDSRLVVLWGLAASQSL